MDATTTAAARTFVITGRGARIRHIDLGEGALCGSPAATEAINRFAKLPVCSACTTNEEFLAAVTAPADPEVHIHFSARVARWVAAQLAEEAPALAADLDNASLTRNGRGFTANVTTTRSRAEVLVEVLKAVSAELKSGGRTTAGMGFREEAVAKGLVHIGDSLAEEV